MKEVLDTLRNICLRYLAGSQYITSDVSSLDYVQIPENVIDTTVAVESTTEFSFSDDVLAKIKKAKSVFKNFDTLFISNNSTGVTLSIGNENTFSKNNNSWTLKLDSTIDQGNEYNIAVPLDSIMKIPQMSYTARIKYNSQKDTYRVVLDNDIITFILSLKK